MPLIQVHLLEGRPSSVKSGLVRELTEVVGRHLGSEPDRISVLITEYGDGDWNVAGEPLRRGEDAVRD